MPDKYNVPELKQPTKQGLYDPRYEHAACGVGLVANIKGEKSHSIIDHGIEILINLGHRGASGADPDTGDGAGFLIQVPHKFFQKESADLGISLPGQGNYGVGVVFLPQESTQREKCEEIAQRATLTMSRPQGSLRSFQ